MDSNNINNGETSNTDNGYYADSSFEPQSQYTTYTGTAVASPIIEESKKGRGFVGALIGALIGGVLWTAIGCLGYISGWIAILIFFLAQFGYKKLTGKMDKFGVIISLVLGLLMIIPATYAAYGFGFYTDLNKAFDNRFTYMEVLSNLPQYMERYDSWGPFLGNLGMGYLFTGVAAIYMGSSTYGNKAKAKREAKKSTKK